VVIDAEGDVLQFSGRTGKYLEPPPGAPIHNIYSMARRGLRLDLRAAVHKASATGAVARQGNVSIGTNGGRQTIDLYVHPLRQDGATDKLFMIVFQDIGGVQPAAPDLKDATDDEAKTLGIRQLEAELRATKERLQTTTEELESSNEELKSGNEELSSMNEELQSANEELETSKEELQSINEELETVNAELNARVEELSRLNSDIANLLESTQIATVFLDRDLHIKSFTPAAKDVFRLVESDAGRPVTHVRARVHIETLEEDAERVLRTLAPIERQVQSTETDARYVMRILPYRSVDDVISGVVVTFTDVTRLRAAETRIGELSLDLRHRAENLETVLDLVPIGIFVTGGDGEMPRANRHGAKLLGISGAGQGLRDVPAPLRLFKEGREVAPEKQPLQVAAASGKEILGEEYNLLRGDGHRVDVMVSATPLFEEGGKTRGAIAALVDITERKHAEARQDALLHELQHRVKNLLAMVSSLARRTLKPEMSLQEFSTAFLARLMAMGRMHDLLARENWRGADIQSIAGSSLASFGAEKSSIALDGPDLMLKSNAAATLGMVFHELATNAAKYGALSTPGGKLELSWRVESSGGGRRLAVLWIEKDGPAVKPPSSEGFGTSFIQRSVDYELGGSVDLGFEPTGLRCRILMPLRSNAEEKA